MNNRELALDSDWYGVFYRCIGLRTEVTVVPTSRGVIFG